MASDLIVSECDPDRVAQKHVCWNEIGGEAAWRPQVRT